MPKINDKNYEYKDIKENKGKLALFTKSNIKMNTDGLNNTNNNANNNPIIKFNNNNIQKIDLKNVKNKYYRCSYKDCNKVFLKQSNLKDHIRAPAKNPTLALILVPEGHTDATQGKDHINEFLKEI